MHISVTKWCIVWYEAGAFWDLCGRSMCFAVDRKRAKRNEMWMWFAISVRHIWKCYSWLTLQHYVDVIMTTMASQITSLTVVYSIVYSDADQRKHQSSASLAFVWGFHRDRWIPRTTGQLRGKCFHLMTSSWSGGLIMGKYYRIRIRR